MISGLKPYAEMRESGLTWLGDIPAHWDVVRAKTVLHAIDFRSQQGAEELLTVSSERGVVPRSTANVTMFQASSYVGHKLCWPGDLVINSLWAWGRGLGVSQHHGIVSTAYGVYRPLASADLDSSYLNLLVRSQAFQWELQVRSKGIWISRLQLTDESFLNAPLPIPPMDEQAAIVRYLDHADRRIRRAIVAKQKLIRLLEEQKRAIIHRAVTRGLDPDVRLKPSGVEWLSDVPEDWTVYRIKQVSQILRGKFTHRPRNDPSLYDGPYPFIQTGEVARAAKAITAYRQTLNDRGLAVSKMFPKGTLVMTIAANIGEVAILDFEACFPDSVVGFVPRDSVDRDYLYYVFTAMKQELLREAPVNTQGNLNVDRIGCRGIALPSIEEQQLIVVAIEKRTMEMDAAIERSSREIALLREFRVRLTADVVTGKLDVREAVANLPEMIEPGDCELDAEVEVEVDSMEEDAFEDQAA